MHGSRLLKALTSGDFKPLVAELTGFKYRSKLNRLVQSNNYYCLTENKAVSYDWWVYYREIDGLKVFNSYRYSVTTAKHQRQTERLLYRLNRRPDIFINYRQSMSGLGLVSIEEILKEELAELTEKLATCKRAKSGKKDSILYKIDRVKGYLDIIAEHRRSKLKTVKG